MNKKIVIVDYGLGNLFSIQQACIHLGHMPVLSSDPELILKCDSLILPGVGSFEIAIRQLELFNLVEPIKLFAKSGKPIMGICLGMQLLFDLSYEFGKHQGLGLISGDVLKFPKLVNENKIRIPHIGWNKIYKKDLDWDKSPLASLKNESLMYFVHSYYVMPTNSSNILTATKYSDFEFCSSVVNDNIFGFQFHPEKSGMDGLEVYNNFLKY